MHNYVFVENVQYCLIIFITFQHACIWVAPREISKYSHYVFAWYTFHVASCVDNSCMVIIYVAIPCVVVSHVVILHFYIYMRGSLTVTELPEWLLIIFKE